jgi:hypothetical protein
MGLPHSGLPLRPRAPIHTSVNHKTIPGAGRLGHGGKHEILFIPHQRLLRIPHRHQKRLLLSRDVDDSDSISLSSTSSRFNIRKIIIGGSPARDVEGVGYPHQRLLRIPNRHQKRLLLSRDVDDSDSISKSCNRAFFMELD